MKYKIGDRVKLTERQLKSVGHSEFLGPSDQGTILEVSKKIDDWLPYKVQWDGVDSWIRYSDRAIELISESNQLKPGQWFYFKNGNKDKVYTILTVSKDKIVYHKRGNTYVHKTEGFADKIILVNKESMDPNVIIFDECARLVNNPPKILNTLPIKKPNMTNTFEAAKVKKYLTDKRVDEIVKAEEDLKNLIEQLEKASSDIDDVIEVLQEDLEELKEGQENTDIESLKKVMGEIKETLEYVNNFKKNTVESLSPVVTEVKRTMAEKFNR